MKDKKIVKKQVVKKVVEKKIMEPTEKVVAKMIVKNDNTRKKLVGTVVSTKMQNTVVVAIERKVAHKLYRKLVKVTKKIKADTNGMDVKVGEVVTIEQTRPISKEKYFKVIRKEKV